MTLLARAFAKLEKFARLIEGAYHDADEAA